ncbi:MAG: TSUP family transporter [Actinomycetota bacterium]
MEVWEILLIVGFTAAGATIHASVGLGIGLVAGPALIVIDPGFLPGPMILAAMFLTARHLLVDGRHCERGTVTRAFIGVPVGLAVGVAVVAMADEDAMRLVVGCAIVLAAGLLLSGLRLRRSTRTDVAGGAAFAFSLIAAGIPGPAAAVAFSDLEPPVYRGTMGFLGIPVSIVSLVLLAAAGEFGRDELELVAWMLPGVAVGLLAGRRVRPFLDRSWFRPAVLWIALLGGAAVVVRQLL